MFADEGVTQATIKWWTFTLGEKEIERFLQCIMSETSEIRIY